VGFQSAVKARDNRSVTPRFHFFAKERPLVDRKREAVGDVRELAAWGRTWFSSLTKARSRTFGAAFAG
jgi:hypothetical protein